MVIASVADVHATLRELPQLQSRLQGEQQVQGRLQGRLQGGLQREQQLQSGGPNASAAASGAASGAAATLEEEQGGVGGSSLLRPLPRARSCADALVPATLCPAALDAPRLAPAAEASHHAATRPARDDEPELEPELEPGAALPASQRLLCAMRSARDRAAAAARARASSARPARVTKEKPGGCVVALPPADEALLREVGAETGLRTLAPHL